MGSSGSQMAPRGAVVARQELEVSRLESEAGWELWQAGGKETSGCCPVSQLVPVLLVGAACEVEPGQPELGVFVLSCAMWRDRVCPACHCHCPCAT